MSEKLTLRTPVTYYGGKQNMVRLIVPLIPEHKIYCEPFAGGAAIFWAKEPAEISVLNDTNRELMNFYKVVKNDFEALEKEVQSTLHSRDLHRKASVIYNNPDMFSELQRAWALWVLSSQSFSSIIDNNWVYDKSHNSINKRLNGKKASFTKGLAEHLEKCSLECADACYIIRNRDTEQSFFYCDQPYYNANMGHYDGYSLEDFKELLDTLSQIKGKFILSSYPSDILQEYTKKFGWKQKAFDMPIVAGCIANGSKTSKRKSEVLTANFIL